VSLPIVRDDEPWLMATYLIAQPSRTAFTVVDRAWSRFRAAVTMKQDSTANGTIAIASTRPTMPDPGNATSNRVQDWMILRLLEFFVWVASEGRIWPEWCK
jgi:hypothetical protein